MIRKMMNDSLETLIKSIYKFTHGLTENLNPVELCFANEINSVNYIESFYKLLDLTKTNYVNYHMKINENFYEIFVHIGEDPDINNLYQMIVCNNYTQVFNFKQDDYDHRKMVACFENPGKVYSFFDGYVIVIESKNKMNFEYKNLELF